MIRLGILVFASILLAGPATARGAEPELAPELRAALAEARDLIATRHPQAAAAALEMLLGRLADAPYARAIAYEILGHARTAQGDLEGAATAFVHALQSDALPAEFAHGLAYNLAQILIRRGRDEEGLGYLEQWFRSAQAPGVSADALAGIAYARTRRWGAAIPHLRIAARAPGADPVWQQALQDCEREARRGEVASGVVRDRLRQAPDSKARWREAIAAYREAHRDAEALALLEVMHRRGSSGAPEILELAQGCLAAGLPNRAAAVLAEALADGRLPRRRTALTLLGDAWRAARVPAQAIAAYRESVALMPDGNLYLAIGELAVTLERWDEAVAALELSLKQTVVRDPARAKLLLGIAALRVGDFERARDALEAASNVLATHDAARWWLHELDAARAATVAPAPPDGDDTRSARG